MSKVKSYLSLIKFSHTIFAMPFALIGFFLGLRATGELVYKVVDVGQWNLNKTVGWEKNNVPISQLTSPVSYTHLTLPTNREV